MMGHNDLLRGSRIPPLLMAPGLSNPQEAVMPKDVDHLVGSEPRRARSPNRHLGQLRIFREIDIAGRKVEFDSSRMFARLGNSVVPQSPVTQPATFFAEFMSRSLREIVAGCEGLLMQ